jgi:hypothetical protein
MNDSLLNATIERAMRFPNVAMLILGSSLLLVGACEKPPSQALASPPPAEQNRASQLPSGLQFKERQIAFLNRIRDADPQRRVIDRAMLNEQNELGLILDRRTEQNSRPDAHDVDTDGRRIPKSGFDRDRLYAFKSAAEGGHCLSRFSHQTNELRTRILTDSLKLQTRKK